MTALDLDKDVFELSKISLSEIFGLFNGKTDVQFIKEKSHVRFLQDYLGKDGLDAKFLVVEKDYINKDYLIDYSTYYSTCFASYPKTGSRLHFFSTDIDLEGFKSQFYNSIIEGVNSHEKHKEFWQKNYLGYIVLKPIPNLFIGFTLLKHYNYSSDNKCYEKDRNFWGIKSYKKHIFGNEVVIDSLAFQEQDQNVAACATIAIWSMLQIAAEDYYVVLQSPSEITRNSDIVAYKGNRLLPNKGLSILQMSQAITKNNLVTEVRERTDYEGDSTFNLYIKKLIHAYSNLRIPPILIINLSPPKDRGKDRIKADYIEDEGDFDGHAIAVNGYKMRPLQLVKRRNSLLSKKSKLFIREGIIWKADLIEKMYVHDDQWGPFSRMIFSGKEKIKTNWELTTENKTLSRTEALVVTVYPKVRIPYDDIESKVIRLNEFFIEHIKDEIIGEFVWDIQLYYSENFKTFIQSSELLDDSDSYDRELQFKLLTKSFPKYIWVATLQIDEQVVLHFIYDATGLSGSNIILTIFGYFPHFTILFKEALEKHQSNKDTLFTYIFDYDIEAYIKAIVE
jgi:hypothetical protein